MKPRMSAQSAVELVGLLEGAGVEVWLDGGWAVDALLGRQTRSHEDLDVIVHERHLPALRRLLGERGFAAQPDGTPSNFVLADGAGLEVDVHAIVFDRDGNGVYRMADGGTWIFPAAGFAGRGEIAGCAVRCLSAEVQVLCHAHGYEPAEKDLRDMELLRERFGVELPPRLQRAAR